MEDICRKYSEENPIGEEEAKVFLKDPSFPIPTHPHIVLDEETIRGKRILVIGDVHGCYDSLIALLEKAKVRDDPNALVMFVGDIISKGPKNCEVLKFVRETKSPCIMGNHERSTVRRLRLMKMKVGFKPDKKKRWLNDLSEEDNEYLLNLPLTISIPSLNVILVHGGLLPGKRLEDHTQDELLLTRNILVEGDKLTATKDATQGQLWGSLWKGPQHVYYGHHAAVGLQTHPFATGLDTGCVYHRSLTGVFLTGDRQMVSVENPPPSTENDVDAAVQH